MNTDNTWFVRSLGGKVLGPFTDSQILKMSKDGVITSSHELRNATRTKGAWVKATQISGISQFLEKKSSNAPPNTDSTNSQELGPNSEGSGLSTIDFASLNLPSDIPAWTTAPPSSPTGTPGTSDYWMSTSPSLAASESRGQEHSKKKSGQPSTGHNPHSANHLLNKIEREQQQSAANEKKHSVQKTRMHIIICCSIILFGIFGSYGAFVLSKPLKLRWAADDAISTMVNSVKLAEALREARLAKYANTGNPDLRSPSAAEINLLDSARVAATELQAILDQMPPDLRKSWETEKIEMLALRNFESDSTTASQAPEFTPPEENIEEPQQFQVDWASLSGPYEIGNKTTARYAIAALKSENIAASSVTGANLYEMDLKTVDVFSTKGFIAADMSFESAFKNDKQTLVIGKISAITKTIPERKDIEKMTAEFDQMMDLYRGGGAVLIVLENSDLTSEAKTTEALREALIKITPEEFRTYQDTKKNAEKVINRIR